MTKSGLVQAVAARLPHLSARDVEILVNTLFDAMTDRLKQDGRIEIRGFGSFTVRHRRNRQGRNPKTGQSIDVPAKRVPFFTAGNELRERVDQGAKQPDVSTPDRGPRPGAPTGVPSRATSGSAAASA